VALHRGSESIRQAWMCGSGAAGSATARLRTPFGPVLDDFVCGELLRLSRWAEDTYDLFFAIRINWRWMW
jgi:hypothetical protein